MKLISGVLQGKMEDSVIKVERKKGGVGVREGGRGVGRGLYEKQ